MQCLPMSSVLETLFRMRGFLLGFLVCAMLCAGAYHQFLRPAPFDPCRVCSTGTRCVAEFCIAQAVQAQPVAKKRTARVRAANSTGGTPAVPNAAQTPTEAAGTGVDAPQVVLRDEDKRVKAVGDKLNTTEFLNMEEATVSDRQLSQQDFDQVFRPRQSEILGCIDDARGDALLEDTWPSLFVCGGVDRSAACGSKRLRICWITDCMPVCARSCWACLFPCRGLRRSSPIPFRCAKTSIPSGPHVA